ncbi:MAG TPA: LysR family transcriptional regulator [Bacteriovoracaceae bacterium]|nr:LysR family transcriptional regulator [Bacteriovoracaceae bacterium]
MNLNIDFRYFKAFLVTAKHLNFSKAAVELGVAQSAVSRQIKLLEESVGDQLIIRSSKKVILTEKGEALLKLISEFEHSVQDIFFSHRNKTIRIGILEGILVNWFTDIIEDYSKISQHQLVIEINTLDRLKEKLQDGKYDIIFTIENIQSELISSLKLFEEKMILISKNEINPKEAHLLPWITYSDQDHLFGLFKKRPEKVLVVNSITSIINLVEKGLGVAIVPEHTLKPSLKLKRYDVKALNKQYIYLSTLNFKSMPTHIKEIIGLIKKRS